MSDKPDEERYKLTRPDGETFATEWNPKHSKGPVPAAAVPPKPVEPTAEQLRDPLRYRVFAEPAPLEEQGQSLPDFALSAKPSLWQRIKNWFTT